MSNWLRRYPTLETVIVNLRSGTVFRGVIYREAGRFLVLRHVEMLSDRDSKMDPRPMNGDVLVASADVDFMQIVAVTDGSH